MRAYPRKGDKGSSKPDICAGGLTAGSLLLLRLLLLGLVLICLPQTVSAAIYSCPAPDGTTIFQDRPCPLVKKAAVTRKKTQQLPFGIHESWFEIPGQAEGRAFCDRRGCECGPIERKHEGSLEQAVADALFMDTGWHHYDISYAAWLDTPSSSSKIYDVRETMIEASCIVMMSQQLLRDFSGDVAQVLKERVREAEERGFDISEPCDTGVENACDYFHSVQLYQQMMSDANALKVSREETDSSKNSAAELTIGRKVLATTE